MPAYQRQPNVFTDPAGVKPAYSWTINHEKEEPIQNSRGITDGAPTSDIGLLPQQGAPTPLVFKWTGKIFTQADFNQMVSWYALCESQSIYLTDFAGNQYEVIIQEFDPNKIGVSWNHRGQLPWYWDYTITIRVLRIISGEWVGRTP